jgi:hypothetical protein
MMSYKKIICCSLTLLMLCCGCGLTEGVVQKESKSSFWFTGNTQNATVYIDDLAPIILSEGNNDQIHYEISPGKHKIVVKRSGNEIVNRVVLLGSGITKEIQIP